MRSPETPKPVAKALRMSLERGFMQATRSETGRLLAALAATRIGTIAECGTGCGVGAAWLRTGAPPATRVLTVERDEELASAVRTMFDADGIDVLHADWTSLVGLGPFSLLFLDASAAQATSPDQVAALLDPGGIVLIDDFTPSPTWPPMAGGKVDMVRAEWLSDPRFVSTQVMVATDTSVVLAVLQSRPTRRP